MKHDEYTPADQLRDRVRSVTVQAMALSQFDAAGGRIADGSVAVYASALQDVVNLFRDRPATVHGVAVDVAAMEAIADYAESVGLGVTL